MTTGIATAAEQENDLLQLVGADAAACLQIDGLKDQLPRWQRSILAQRLQKLEIYREWTGGAKHAKLQDATQAIERATGQPFESWVKGLFGRQVVLAVYAQADKKPVGVLLTRAEQAATLQSAIAAWNGVENQQTDSKEHAGQSYLSRSRLNNAGQPIETVYYATFGEIFAVSDNEEAIRRVCQLRTAAVKLPPPDVKAKDGPAPDTLNLAMEPNYRIARESLATGTVLSIYLNPRAWDATLNADRTQDKAQLAVLSAWRTLKSVIVGVSLAEGVALESILHYDSQATSKAWQAAVAKTAGPAAFQQKIPRQALISFAGRNDLGLVSQLVKKYAPDRGKDRSWDSFRDIARGLCLGHDLFSDVLPQLGPNWGWYVVPNHNQTDDSPAVDGAVAWELPSAKFGGDESTPDARATVRQGVENALNTSWNLGAAWLNSRGEALPAVVRTETVDSVTVRWLEGVGPQKPAFAITKEYLVIASSPDAIREFIKPAPDGSIADLPEYRRFAKAGFPEENQVLYANFALARRVVLDRKEFIARQLARFRPAGVDEIQKRLERFADVLQLFDGTFIAARIEPSSVRVVIGGGVVTEKSPE